MSVYLYRARDRAGNLITGEIIGESANVVMETVAASGLLPISARPKPFAISLKSLLQKKPTIKDIANMTRQFQVMFAAGTPMDRILLTLSKQSKNPVMNEALGEIQRDVAAGMRPSAAFRKHPHLFGSLYTSMLEVGETGGFLDKTLKEMSKIMEKEYEIKSKVKSAMLYPKIVLFVLGAVAWGMLAFVIPPFQAFYAKFGKELPLPTKIMLSLSKLTTTYWYIPVIIGIAVFIAWRKFSATETGKRFTSYVALRVPVFGRLNMLVVNARFGHLVAGLYRAGVPLTNALGVVAGTISNVFYAEEVSAVKSGVEQGKSLSKCMESAVYFEPMVQEACAVGERIGKIDDLLEAIATFYDGEVDDMLKNLSTLIEPILLVFLFGMVLMLALSIYLPMWNISSAVLT